VPAKGTRPTTDRVRESLFNVVAARLDFDGIAVLDLYAGSGALGLEALSRGAAAAMFVESDARAADVIARNIAELRLGGAQVRRTAVTAALAATPPAPMDLVFADPPYEVDNRAVEAVLRLLAENGWVTGGSIMVVERPASAAVLSWPSDWEPLKDRRYGDTRLEWAEYDGGSRTAE
jgi:16S rRNA (guanine(966)-N(2))-methyltransferase RsmD